MINNSIWGNTTSLLVTYNFEDEAALKEFRKALDQVLNTSAVERVIIVVSIQKSVNKSSLSPHFLIYYNGPSDYTLFGNLKDHQLANELLQSFDVLLCSKSSTQKLVLELYRVTGEISTVSFLTSITSSS